MATCISLVAGISLLIYSVFTDYDLGAASVIKIHSHLMLDIITGGFLAISPWLYDFSDYVFLPHLTFGILLITGAMLTGK